LSTHAPFLTNQTRSKCGPTLGASYSVLPVITSRPLRLPHAHSTYLAGFTRLDSCLPQAESCGDARTSGPTSVIFHRMPMAIPRVPCRCPCPLLPCRLWPSPIWQRISVYPRPAGFIPHPNSPSYSRPGFKSRGCTIHFMLRPAVLAGPPGWVRPVQHCGTSRLGTMSGQVRPVCYHPSPPSAYTSKRATDVTTTFQVAR